MTVAQLRMQYIITFIAAAILFFLINHYYKYNSATEIGCVIICIAVISGAKNFQAIHHTLLSEEEFQEGEKRKIQMDIKAILFGTLINGFSYPIGLLIK